MKSRSTNKKLINNIPRTTYSRCQAIISRGNRQCADTPLPNSMFCSAHRNEKPISSIYDHPKWKLKKREIEQDIATRDNAYFDEVSEVMKYHLDLAMTQLKTANLNYKTAAAEYMYATSQHQNPAQDEYDQALSNLTKLQQSCQGFLDLLQTGVQLEGTCDEQFESICAFEEVQEVVAPRMINFSSIQHQPSYVPAATQYTSIASTSNYMDCDGTAAASDMDDLAAQLMGVEKLYK